MPELQLNLIKGDKTESNVDYRDNLPVNMLAVRKDILGSKGYMISYPGLTSFGTGSGIDRGACYNERFENQFRMSGTNLVEINTNGTVTVLGMVSGTDQAAMAYSFNTQCVVADGRMWLYSASSGFVEVTDSDLGNPIDVVWIDNYYFLTDGEYIYHTNVADETAIDPLKFATAEFMPDPSLGLSKTPDNKVIVWGRYSCEYFINAATENFAFQRVETRAQKIGIVATHAKTESGGKFYICGGYKNESVGIYAITVGSAKKMSSREIDQIISKYNEPALSDMRLESRIENNIALILVHLPEETLCFNENVAVEFGTNYAWSILKSDILGDEKYRAINGVFDARIAKWIYGDKQDERIGYLDNSVCTQYGNIVESIMYTPLVRLDKLSIDEIEIETISGYNSAADATVAISTTYDGEVFGFEYWELYSNAGEYNRSFILRRLGYVSDWIGFKFRCATTSRMAFAMLKITVS